MLGMLAVLGALLLAVSAAGASADTTKRTYIVQMLKDPVASYDGGVAGIPATQPARGGKVDADSPAAQRYSALLRSDHAEALAQVGGAPKLYDYSVTYNGFAAQLTEAQAEKLEKVPGVLAVTEDYEMQPDTSSTPSFIGLDSPTGLWARSGGVAKAGEGVIIGVVDTGVWPEHPSFSDKDTRFGFPRLTYSQPPSHWGGICQPGEDFTPRNCNHKLIGARYYVAGFGQSRVAPWDFLSPRDYNGHGSHTMSTAGGNNGVQATGDAASLGKISGMAPRARVAMYKVCWEEVGSDGGCNSSDSVAAIDQAVADGVDVINFSISGSRTNFLDPVEVAFLFAADAGVFVATSAGNEGPGASTVAHPSPWVTSTAASTHSRGGVGTVTFGNGTSQSGQSLAANAVSGPFVNAENAGKAGANATEVRLCFLGTLDPAKVAGKIVLCDRGVNARIDKSLEVKNTGGIGMVLINTSTNSVNADLHFVPSIHIDHTNYAAIKAYANSAGATASISKGTVTNNLPAPFIAAFSSRGPLLAGAGDVLKPDIAAPGQDVLAAVAPPGNHGRLFDMLSGTSMASPHIAGLAAMLTQLQPSWSPMAKKSALMTTAYSFPGNSFDWGAGHVDASKAGDPGLVYDSDINDWFMFLQGTDCHCLPANFPRIDPSDLNQASIAIGQLPGRQTVTRTVTNVSGASETYNVAFNVPGINATASPSSFTIAPGASQTLSITFTRGTAALNAYTHGFMTLNGSNGHAVRSPVVIRPVPLAAPTNLTGTGTSGSQQFTIAYGYDGTWSADVRGLIPADVRAGNVAQDPDSTVPADPDTNGPGLTRHDFTVPAGTTYARFSLFDAEVDGATDDLDLYVYRRNADGTKTLVGVSGGGTAEEEVNLTNPAAATYSAYVHGWGTDGPDANYNLFGWILGSTAAGNATVTPSSGTATTGTTQNLTFAWTGLTAGTKYLGRIAFSGVSGGNPVAGMPLTTVRVDG
jgi:hypothetical protein